jgi:hypothetical protein
MKRDYALDFYGEKLNIGDEVIPMMSEAILMRIKGTISNIGYNEQDNIHYINITNENGKVLNANFNPIYFTTKARYDQRENSEYVYKLELYCKNTIRTIYLPLNNFTNPNYDFPNNIDYIVLGYDYDIKEENGSFVNSSNSVLWFGVDGKVEFYYNKKYKHHNLKILHNGEIKYAICPNHKTFKTYNDMIAYMRQLIIYFNNADLTNITERVNYNDVDKCIEFRKKLVNTLNEKQ